MREASAMSQELHHLFKAIKEDRHEQVKVALENDQSLANAKDNKGTTALMIAAETGNTGALDLLLRHNAHINYQFPEKGSIALMLAALNGNIDAVKFLLKWNAKVDVKDAQGQTAADYARQGNHQNIVDLLQPQK